LFSTYNANDPNAMLRLGGGNYVTERGNLISDDDKSETAEDLRRKIAEIEEHRSELRKLPRCPFSVSSMWHTSLDERLAAEIERLRKDLIVLEEI
jgi:hypothetical protein